MPKLRADPPPNTRKPVTVRAIHPSAGVRAWYQAALDDLIRKMHADVKAGVMAAYSMAEPAEMAHDAAPPRNPSLFIRRALTRLGKKWTLRLDRLSVDVAEQFARKNFAMTQTQMKTAFSEAGFTVKFAPTAGSVAAYHQVAAEQVNLIRSIPAQYLKEVQTKVWTSVMKGADLSTLSTDLQETYGVTTKRAALIARDQNAKAKAIIERTRRSELGVTHAIWMHSAGGKVPRATHVAMDGKPYEIARGMWDSAEGEYVLPGQLINCRCTSKAVIPAFDTVEAATARAVGSRPFAYLEAARGRAK